MEVQVDGPATLRVKRELEGGWFQWVSMPLPAVLTIQSGINQLRYATLKGIMAAKKKEIRKAAPPAASTPRQKIVSLYVPEKTKKTQIIGGFAGRGREGARSQAARRGESDSVTRVGGESTMILVIAEQRGGKLNRATLGGDRRRAAARQADRDDRSSCCSRRGIRRRCRAGGCRGHEVVTLEQRRRSSPTRPTGTRPRSRPRSTSSRRRWSCCRTRTRRATSRPKLAARMDRSIITDVTGVKNDGGETAFVRPMFQGKLTADVVPRAGAAFRDVSDRRVSRGSGARAGRAGSRARAAGRRSMRPRSARSRRRRSRKRGRPSICRRPSGSSRSAAASRSRRNIALAQQLADALGAELAASRPICDAGWLPMERQVGSSGQTVAPKLYLALGISGAIQHSSA